MNDERLWRRWLERWDRFQDTYVPHRELQLRLLVEYASTSKPDGAPRVLDLCCGPGTLATRLLRSRPDSEVVAVDADPWLMEMGRRAARSGDAISWVETDVRDPVWTDAVPTRNFDAAVLMTALSWFDEVEIRRLYRSLAEIVRPGGMFLAADVFPSGDRSGRVLATRMLDLWRARRIADGGEHWVDFWREARAQPEFEPLLARRDARLGMRRPYVAPALDFHEAALADAGFAASRVIWRFHANAILLAIRPR